MSIRKKLLIAMLTATVAAAGTASLAACKEKEKDDTPPPPPGPVTDDEVTVTVSDEAYEIAVANGFEGTKDEWIDSLESTYEIDDKEIKDVSANADGNIVLTFSDKTEQTITMDVKLYKVVCKDNVSGAPVANAWFEIGYMDGYTFTKSDSVKVNYAKSDENGVATFHITPEEGIEYVVKIADPTGLASYLKTTEVVDPLPDKYVIAFGKLEGGFDATSLSFVDSRTVEALFENASSYFYQSEKTKLPYTRTATGESNATSNGAFKVDVSANSYRYVYFCSYVSPTVPDSASDEEGQKIRDNAVLAASGTYKFTITPADGVTLYKFTGTSGYAVLNDKNVPAIAEYVTGGTADATYDNGGSYPTGVYTGTNSITLNITKADATGDSLFGIYATSDCEVSITVERLGDAEEEAPAEVKTVEVPANLELYPEKAENTTLTLMPVTGSMSIVKGSDGFYHVGSADGPVLLVQLNNALSRVSTIAISKLPDEVLPNSSAPIGDSALTFPIMVNGKITEYRNYASVIAAYAKKANEDGVYGVDETLYSFLKDYGAAGKALNAIPGNAYNWLLPCQYYQPADGMPVTGTGTSSDPYVLMTGKNSVEIQNSAYLSFSAPEAAIYTFTVSSGTINSTSAFFKSTRDDRDVLYVCVTSINMPVTLNLNSTGVVTITVTQIDQSNRNIMAEYDDDTQTTKGSSESPVTILPGVNNVIISSTYEEGVWVNFSSPALIETTEYVFDLFGDNAVIIYNGVTYNSKNPLTLTLEDDKTEYKLLLTAKNQSGNVVYGNFMLNIKVAGDDPVEEGNALKIGNTTVSLTPDEAWDGVQYSFTAELAGTYTISVAEESGALITDVNDTDFWDCYIDAGGGMTSYTFTLEAGETINFLVGQMGDGPFTITVEEGGILNDDSPLTLGEARDIIIPADGSGYETYFYAPSTGPFVVTIEVAGASATEFYAYYKPLGVSRPFGLELTLKGNVYTGEFEVDEYYLTTWDNNRVGIILDIDSDTPVTATITISEKNN